MGDMKPREGRGAVAATRLRGSKVRNAYRRPSLSGDHRNARLGFLEPIADAVQRADVGRRELAAQVRDVRSQQLRIVDVARTPDLPEQGCVRVHPTAVAQQHAEQAELDGREMDLPAVPMDGAPREVDGEPAFDLDALVPCVT